MDSKQPRVILPPAVADGAGTFAPSPSSRRLVLWYGASRSGYVAMREAAR